MSEKFTDYLSKYGFIKIIKMISIVIFLLKKIPLLKYPWLQGKPIFYKTIYDYIFLDMIKYKYFI